jgi:hypothetical protein
LEPIGEWIPCSVAFSNILWIGSIARMKSIGESGSPCLSPRWCRMGVPANHWGWSEMRWMTRLANEVPPALSKS